MIDQTVQLRNLRREPQQEEPEMKTHGSAVWQGEIRNGNGTFTFSSGRMGTLPARSHGPKAAVSNRRKAYNFAVGTRVTSRSPPRSVRAAFPHTACMGLSLSRGHHSYFCRPLSFHSFVRPAPRAFFRPDRIFLSPSRAAAVKDGASSAPHEGLSLTDASTVAGCRRSGGWPRDDPRGACHWPRSIA